MVPDMRMVCGKGKAMALEANIGERVAIAEHILEIAIVFRQSSKQLLSGLLP